MTPGIQKIGVSPRPRIPGIPRNSGITLELLGFLEFLGILKCLEVPQFVEVEKTGIPKIWVCPPPDPEFLKFVEFEVAPSLADSGPSSDGMATFPGELD